MWFETRGFLWVEGKFLWAGWDLAAIGERARRDHCDFVDDFVSDCGCGGCSLSKGVDEGLWLGIFLDLKACAFHFVQKSMCGF
ncbi:hypothetical protein [Bartonella tribocorum]|uniref:Uncharacterized protein n=1 Tax=Bartonella tribocorum TaxID=85701 RepID=A0A2N9Y8U3_9HYPH|nr:hypothetical protein [Bartonella tribocorum]PIT68126.1 hypothetical protein CER18_08175 [Bartonella tribocorum]